jgi:Uma2 family endonuclease
MPIRPGKVTWAWRREYDVASTNAVKTNSACDAILSHAELLFDAFAEHNMGMPARQSRRWTAADVRSLIQESRPWPRYELIDGELLVTPSPSTVHQRAVGAIHVLLHSYCESEGFGEVLLSPADIELIPESIVQPDVFVVPGNSFPEDEVPRWTHVRSLCLAVEVVSPTSMRQDRVIKRDFYLTNGVEEYWIVDLDARVVERWLPDSERPEILREVLVWQPAPAREALEVVLEEFFREKCRLPRIV